MWLKLSLVFFAAFVSADHNAAWNHRTEYVYQVRGRSLTSLDQSSSSYSGIFLKAKLVVRPRLDGDLGAQFSDLEYADFHDKLKDDWRQEILDSELQYKEINLPSGNVKIVMNDGVVQDVFVDRTVPNWQANMMKGILSQIQLDTEAENEIRSSINIKPEHGNYKVFKTMEETVSGETETLYEIHPLPEHVLQTTPCLAPLKKIQESDEYLEVIRTKNYTHSRQTPGYHFGLQGIHDFDVNNRIGEFFSRSSMTRAVLSGNLNNFTIQSSVTTDEVALQPTLLDSQRGSTRTLVNITLVSIQSQEKEFEEIASPIGVGLVYRYNEPFGESNQGKPRLPRGADVSFLSSAESGATLGSNHEEDLIGVAEKPHINEPPGSPYLPFTVGYDGQAISKKQNIEESVRSLAVKIGQEFGQPENIPKQNTVGKFVILSSLVRIMNREQVSKVASKLYTQDQHGANGFSWIAYRDAVAQAGTGPALLNIKEWIVDGKISGGEAALVVADAADSARQPTEKYMETYFEMIQDENIMRQEHLNDSLILSFTNLVHQVYADKHASHNKFPVHSFGSFNTKQGLVFVLQTVIPHLAQKLETAVSQADSQQIHVYIRALGNVGHQQILSVFKPYLEGTKKMSQFQRVLMVTALDKLIESNPKVARSVLYKIYQNRGEFEQVRVAAVYQLIRTEPSAAMLQRMAMYTNVDTNNYLNSAVQSVIRSASELKHPKFAYIRAAAQSAVPLLTSKEFGAQNSKSFILEWVAEQMHNHVKQVINTFGGEDSAWPKGVSYLLRGNFGGVRQDLLKMQWMVSSVEDLVNVFQQQTKWYRSQLKEKQSYRSVNTKWSSEYTAKRLNMQNEQREQFEKYIFLQIDSLVKVWSFDNRTVDNLTEIVKELEQALKNGKHFDHNKMAIQPEIALSLPTEMGLPFIYTYDRPTLSHFEGDVKVVSDPQISSPDGLNTPASVEIQYQLNGFMSARIQSQFGFFTPFNHKRYSAGYDKNLQLRLPSASGKVLLDVANGQVTIEGQMTEPKNVNLVRFSTWPYTSQYDIHDVKPETRIIRKENPQRINAIWGQRSSGIAFSLQVTSDQPIDAGLLYNKVHEQKFATLLGSWLDDNIQHTEVNIGINSEQSATKKVVIHMGYQQKYSPGANRGSDISENPSRGNPIYQESWDRQNQFLKNSSEGIFSAHSRVLDVIVQFEGQRTIKYSATAADARSNIDPKGRLLMQAQKDNQQGEPVKLFFSGESQMSNTNSLDLGYAVDLNSNATFSAKAGVEQESGNAPEISVNVKLSKSEGRKQYLKAQRQYQQCEKQMRGGNKQLPACAMLTERANLLDQFSFDLNYKNIDPAVSNVTYKLYSILREYLYPRVSENLVVAQELKSSKDHLSLRGQFSPDLSKMNASVRSEYGSVEINDVEVDDFVKNILVVHPVYRLRPRLEGYALNYHSYEPICVIDQDSANTLDNKTYPINLSNDWVVLLHYIPRRPSPIKGQPELTVTEQLNQNIESYIVYGRAYGNDQSKKEIKIVIQSSNTRNRVIDVTLKPSESNSGYGRLFIQGEQIMYDDKGTHIFDNYMEVYKLPNNELKVEVYDIFFIVYDGVRAKIRVLGDKFRDASRGLCGTFTGEEETDFTHNGNCIIHNSEVFVASYSVSEKERTKRMNDMFMIRDEGKKCYQKVVQYTRVVSMQDSGISLYTPKMDKMLKKTKYVKMADKTCFSASPLPACKPGYKERTVSESIPVVCVTSSQVSNLWIRQIKKGINPSMAHKQATTSILMNVAQSCD